MCLQGYAGGLRTAGARWREEHSVSQQRGWNVYGCEREEWDVEHHRDVWIECDGADLDNDGWPDIYVANDSTAATYYQNQKDGTFKDTAIEAGIAYSPDGKPQAGMGWLSGTSIAMGCWIL